MCRFRTWTWVDNSNLQSDLEDFVFKLYDINELDEALYHLIPASEVKGLSSPEKVVDEILDEIDDNEDGVITKSELIKAH